MEYQIFVAPQPPGGAQRGDIWIDTTTGESFRLDGDWRAAGNLIAPKFIQGAVGPQGEPGSAGAMGPQGPPGETGPAGPQGIQGPPGLQGPAGTGEPGDQGDPGPQGPVGPEGPAGPAGAMGPQGDPGVPGAPGVDGAQGIAGPAGSQGPKGDKGDPGDIGQTGPQGDQGPQGIQGVEGPAGPALPRVKLAADVSTSSTSLTDVTGLAFSMLASTDYEFEFLIPFQSALATCGVAIALNGPASPNLLAYRIDVPISASAVVMRHGSTYNAEALGTAVDTINASRLATIRGVIRNGLLAGSLQARFRSETGSAVVVKAGALVRYQQV